MPITKKPLKVKKTGLKRTKPARTPKAKKTAKRLPLEKKTARELVKVADKEFSRYIRLRDAEYADGQWVGTCITCPRPIVVITREGKWVSSSQNCHYIDRGVHQLRYDEVNCNLGCAHCNAWRDKTDMYDAYHAALDKKYGPGTANRLKDESKLEGSRKLLTKPELLQIIHDCRTRVAIILEMKYN